MAANYTYEAINATEEIRLLKIDQVPPLEDELLHFSVVHTSFRDGERLIPYNAVSYAWGDASIRGAVVLDGTCVDVPVSSEIALRNLHRHLYFGLPKDTWFEPIEKDPRDIYMDESQPAKRPTSLYFWIDAICMDQSNPDERTEQVNMMWRVYSSADLVLAWLGPGNDQDEPAFEDLVSAFNQYIDTTTKNHQGRPLRYLVDYSMSNLVSHDIKPGHIAVQNWSAIKSLAQLPYFERLWVVQELALAKRAYIVEGRRRLEWSVFAVSVLWLVHRGFWEAENAGTWIEGLHRPATIARLCLSVSVPTSSLGELLLILSLYSCGDARDRVNGTSNSPCAPRCPPGPCLINTGVLGLWSGSRPYSWSTPPSLMPPAASYRASVEKVYHAAVRWAVCEEGRLDLLSLARRSQTLESDQSSWVVRLDDAPLIMSWEGDKRYFPLARAPLVSMIPLQWEEHADDRVLRLRGCVVEKINVVGEWLMSKMLRVEGLPRVLQQSYQLAVSTHCCTDESLGRTLILDSRILSLEIDERGRSEWSAFSHYDGGLEDFPDEHPEYCKEFSVIAKHRRFFITDEGRIGMAPRYAEANDYICMLFGHNVPFVLRDNGNDTWHLVGDAYVDGIMDGKYIKQLQKEDRREDEKMWFNIR